MDDHGAANQSLIAHHESRTHSEDSNSRQDPWRPGHGRAPVHDCRGHKALCLPGGPQYSINSTPSIPFEEVNNFHNWEAWSPWVKIDPNLQQNYEGPTNGVGAIYTWAGNNKVGAGRMTITDTRTNEFIKIKLEFLKPFPSAADTEFSFKPDNTNTTVSWKMSGNHTFISKAMSLFIDMDQMIGPSFDQGLNQLKSISEVRRKKTITKQTYENRYHHRSTFIWPTIFRCLHCRPF